MTGCPRAKQVVTHQLPPSAKVRGSFRKAGAACREAYKQVLCGFQHDRKQPAMQRAAESAQHKVFTSGGCQTWHHQRASNPLQRCILAHAACMT
jgi:hypothetical protein